VSSRSASPYSESDRLLKNVNYSGCTVYAGTLSADLKELYFTLFPTGTPEADKFRIVVAKRNSIQEPFGQGAVIENITGASVEGPSISSDGKKLFFHKKDSATNRFKIYQVTRP
jgi:hypothetical protein